jgi:hypothetical protein
LGSLAEAHVEMGIYAFAASVILTTFLAAWIGRQGRDPADGVRPANNAGS